MTLIESMVPAVEVYSIDEAFADLTGVDGLDARGRRSSCQSINRLLQAAFFIINVACLALLAKSNNSEAVWSGYRI